MRVRKLLPVPSTVVAVIDAPVQTPAAPEKLVDGRFLTLVASAMFSAMGFSSTLPLVPRYVEGELGGGKVAVGLALGIFAFSAIFARPMIGRLGDSHGRRLLIVGGTFLTGLTVAAHALAVTYPILLGVRVLMGAFQGAFFVGSATMVNDLAPPERRGEATSYFSVAIYGGMAFGPMIGDIAQSRWGFGPAFVVGGASLLTAAAIGLFLPDLKPEPAPIASGAAPPKKRILHPNAVWPGFILFLGIVSFTALNGFLPLHMERFDLGSIGLVFLVYGILVIVVRLAGSRLPDILGTAATTTIALAGLAIGLTVIGAWTTTLGVYAGVFVLAAGGSLLYPALLIAAVEGVPAGERAQATSTFTMFFEISAGVGGPVLGVAAALAGTSGAFYAAAIFAAAGIPLVSYWAALTRRRDALGPLDPTQATVFVLVPVDRSGRDPYPRAPNRG